MEWYAVAYSLKRVLSYQWPVPGDDWAANDPRRDEIETARNRFYLPELDLEGSRVTINWTGGALDTAQAYAGELSFEPYVVITDGGASIDGVAEGDARRRSPLGRKNTEYLLHVNLVVPDSGRGIDGSPPHLTKFQRDMSVLPYQIAKRVSAFPVLSNIYKSRTDPTFGDTDIDDRSPIRSADVMGWTRQYDWDSANLRWLDVAGIAFDGVIIVVRVIQEVDFGIGTVERGGQNKYSVGFKESDNNLLLPETIPTGGIGTPVFPEYQRARNN